MSKERNSIPKADVGVVVGRFQVPFLHEGHRRLLDFVNARHGRMIVFLGLSPCRCTANNPLDFEARKYMIQEAYPNAIIAYVKDTPSDQIWSESLDDQIDNIIVPGQTAILYGSRDSFIPHYYGKFPTYSIKSEHLISGTEIRKQVAIRPKKSEDFRMGAIWAINNQWSRPFVTIDVGIFNDTYDMILLGRKKHEELFRLIGGFVPSGEKFSDTVKREALEETNLIIHNIRYVDSFPVDDWRYRGEKDKITTVLHTAEIKSGKPAPGDDIYALKWFPFTKKLLNEVVDNHVILIEALLKAAFGGQGNE